MHRYGHLMKRKRENSPTRDHTVTAQGDVWVDAGVVWAAAHGPLAESGSKDLVRRACALAAETANWRFMFDYRHSTLTHDVLALNRHAELMCQLGLPEHTRAAMLCRHRSADYQFWERVLNLRGLAAGTFTDGEAAVVWLHKHQPGDTDSPTTPALLQTPINVDTIKRQLNQFALERAGAPRSQVAAELAELVECLFAHAELLGVDLQQTAMGTAAPSLPAACAGTTTRRGSRRNR